MAGDSLIVEQWRGVSVLTLRGEVSVGVAAEIGRRLARLQRESGVFIDVWDVSSVDPLFLAVLRTAKQRGEDTGNDFAVIASRGGVAAQEIEAAGLDGELPTFETRHDAAASLRRK